MKALALLGAVVALVGCGGSGSEPAATGLRDLTSLEQLREDFEAAEGKARVVVLLAPL